ncbi:hypothetical protein [Methylomonas rapida]|uniref:Cytochrome c domain-containing protein n=1 Tax=Methylomonas rapida TaxID=2963939 RepID=A0ABY7GL70_9GAMM|nr:hypothetical protein [Methylomonas rapida]WAR45247.1 hypothetical protein NM686_001690 [Methylomonas rapida]
MKKNFGVASKKIFKLTATFAAVSALALALNAQYEQLMVGSGETINSVGHGDVDTLKAALDVWRENYEAKGGSPEVLKISLGYSKVLSQSFTKARGQLKFNLKNGALAFHVSDLNDGQYALWLVDNRNGSVMPDAEDNMVKIADFAVADGKGLIESQLERGKLLDVTMDAVVVTESGKTPLDGVAIAGAPDLMHKLYYADKPWLTTGMGDFNRLASELAAPFEFLLPKAAQADTVSDLTPVLGALVAKGRQIFHNETFGGNGRTCGTCHRADNNFTLDPNYIMTLPQSDPLFVAENNPELAELENPVLMRKHGLILTNIDGPDVDIFRSVPHTLSMATTIKSETLAGGGEFEADEAFANATGWSGDGAPGSGSLREFTLGAVAQHMPKRMSRMAGVDFRLPTEDELDAVEAYTLSLGRSKDYPVYQLSFNDPLIEAGKDLFDTKVSVCADGSAQKKNAPYCPDGAPVVQGTTANCNGCHQNAGGRSSSTNANPTRNTGIEQMKIHPARLLKPDMAYDGGFGTEPAVCGPDGEVCYGDGRFNTPPLIEAADTAPFFHNNAVSTLEEAIAAYNSDAFNTSPGSLSKGLDRKVKLDSTQVVAVASFLRAINALENIRLSDQLDKQAQRVGNNATARELARLAGEESKDAIQVLKEGVLGNNWKAVQKLEKAANYQQLAQLAPAKVLRNSLINRALAEKQEARALIASCDPNAPVPSTVVVPPAENLYTCAEIGL